MSLPHGKAISSEELERIVSRQFSPQQFASLCNAVAWISAGRRCTSLPSLTERVNVKDKGVDLEWRTEIAPDEKSSSPLVGAGLNIHQYKQRDIFAGGRDKVFSKLEAGLKGAVKEIHVRTGQRSDRYVIFVNLDLSHKQTGDLRKAALHACEYPDAVHVEIAGAAELAAFLNGLPHLRSAFFATAHFLTRQRASEDHNRAKAFGVSGIPIIGREEELRDLRAAVHDPAVRVIVLSGPPHIGKTRLALEATDERPNDAVFATDPHSITVADLLALETPNIEVLVVIQDPDPQRVASLIEQELARPGLKLLLTLATQEKCAALTFGNDSRIVSRRLGPLSRDEARKLLVSANKSIEFNVATWILEHAGGNPGVILLAAKLGTDLKSTTGNFIDEIARAFEAKARAEFGPDVVLSLQVLSTLTHVGFRSKASSELEVVCKFFDGTISPNKVLNCLPQLEAGGLIRVAGSYAEVVPPLLANRLAGTAFRGRHMELLSLPAQLSRAGQLRLLRRLRVLKTEEAHRFWEEVFASSGPFGNLESALSNANLLREVVGAAPQKVATLVETGLAALTREQRLDLSGSARRELMWSLEQLLFRKKTVASAIRCLAMLAEAETETYGNNATNVFFECFYPRHPQLPFSLGDRLHILRDLLSPGQSLELRKLALGAVKSGVVHTSTFVHLRYSTGAEPFDEVPTCTYGDLRSYVDDLMELAMQAAQDTTSDLSSFACSFLPEFLTQCAIGGREEQAFSRLDVLVEWAVAGKACVSPAETANHLHFFRKCVKRRRPADEKAAAALQKWDTKAEELIRRIESAGFSTRLRRWTENRHTDFLVAADDEELESRVRAMGRILDGLAKEVLQNPSLLTNELRDWLCAAAQLGGSFFFSLGKQDEEASWFPKIREVGVRQDGIGAFADYCAGLSHKPELLNNMLDDVAKDQQMQGAAIVGGMRCLPANERAVGRLEKLVRDGRVSVPLVGRLLAYSYFVETLEPPLFLRVLTVLAKPDFEHAAVAIDWLAIWLHRSRQIEGPLAEFGWRCLEAMPVADSHLAFECDKLAATLAQGDPERGLKLLETLLSQPNDKEPWNPVKGYGHNEFFNVLLKHDRRRTLRGVLSPCLSDELKQIRVAHDLREILDQEGCADVLIEFCRESPAHALAVCESITPARPGFWSIAHVILEKYSDDDDVRSAVSKALVYGIHWGTWSSQLEQAQASVKDALSQLKFSSGVRKWLEELEESLRTGTEQERVREADEDVND